METLIKRGNVVGVADFTTTEIADQICGGVLAACPDRLENAGLKGIPQVVSLGALDMCNFGPFETLPRPQVHSMRKLLRHNENVTLMRTSKVECAKIGRVIAGKLNKARGATELFIPLKGLSSVSTRGGIFYDNKADEALIKSLKENIDTSKVVIHEINEDINDDNFALAMARKLHELIGEGKVGLCYDD